MNRPSGWRCIIPELKGDKLFVNVAELHRRDALGTRAFRALAFRVGYRLAFLQVVEGDALDAR